MTCSLDNAGVSKTSGEEWATFMTLFEFFFFFQWLGGVGVFDHELESTNVQRSVGIIDPCANYSVLIHEYTSYRSLVGSKRVFCLGKVGR